MKAKKFLGIGAILSLMICVAVSSSVPHKKFLMTGGATALAGVVLCAYEMNKAFQAAKKLRR